MFYSPTFPFNEALHLAQVAPLPLPHMITITMNGARLIRPRTLRPHLSNRYRCLRRFESTNARPASATPSKSRIPTPSLFRRYRNAIVWSTLAAVSGTVAGNFALHLIAPPAMPMAGTHEDNVLVADLNRRIDDEFKVKVLRGKCLGVAKQLKGEEAGWVEVLPASLDAGEQLPFHDRLVDQLQGAKGLGVQRVFWNLSEQKMVAILWLGGSLSGWPGVVHGGLLATALEDKIALAEALAHGSSAVSSAAIPQRLPGSGSHATTSAPMEPSPEPVQFSIDYKKPTYANYFHVIRVAPAYSEEMQGGVRYGIPGAEWTATLETMDAQVCVQAAAKFSPRSTAERVEEKVVDAAKWTYDEFKQRVWPSRQQETLQEG